MDPSADPTAAEGGGKFFAWPSSMDPSADPTGVEPSRIFFASQPPSTAKTPCITPMVPLLPWLPCTDTACRICGRRAFSILEVTMGKPSRDTMWCSTSSSTKPNDSMSTAPDRSRAPMAAATPCCASACLSASSIPSWSKQAGSCCCFSEIELCFAFWERGFAGEDFEAEFFRTGKSLFR